MTGKNKITKVVKNVVRMFTAPQINQAAYATA